jgi:hypothetical protein
MSWGEATRLVTELARDPSAHTAAALAGWEHPISREWMLLVSIRDAFITKNFKDGKPWPLPWPTTGHNVIGAANEQVLSQDEIDRVLREMAGR